MAKYLITIKGKGQKEVKGDSPQEAFATLFPNIELQEIQDKTQAQVCIELLNGKRKSRTFYYIKKVKQVKAQAKSTDDDKYNDLAKAYCYIGKSLLDMGDSYAEVVNSVCFSAKLDFDAVEIESYYGKAPYKECKTDEEILDKAYFLAYRKMIAENNKALEADITYWNEYDYYDTLDQQIKYEGVTKITQSKIYNSLVLICKYAESKRFDKEAVDALKTFILRQKGVDIDAINIGYAVGRNYWKYLSADFGTKTNDVFTVGHKIVKDEERKYKEYKGFSYVLHKDINTMGSPDTPLCALFKTDKENIYIDVLLARQGNLAPTIHTMGIVGYIYKFGTLTFNKKESVETIMTALADKFNKLLPVIYDIADNQQALYKLKDYNAPLETITNIEHITDDEFLLNAAISRWTTIRGDKTPAKVDKIQMKGEENIYVLYANNVSESGADCRLYVEYIGGIFTIRVIEGTDIQKVICKETVKMNGPINKNSPAIAKALCGCLISANVKKL